MIGFFSPSGYKLIFMTAVRALQCELSSQSKTKGHHKKEGNSKVIDLNAVENTPQG